MKRDDGVDEVFSAMTATGTWHFPPVMIEAGFGAALGARSRVGRPYYLIEGTHRLSYLRSMLQLGLVEAARELHVIEIVETESMHR